MGTSTATADELTSIRMDLGRVTDGYTDPEIQTLWGRNSAASTQLIQLGATKAMIVERALNDAVGSVDYKAGNTSESLSQYVAQLERMFKRYERYIDQVAGRNIMAIGVTRSTVPQPAVPEDDSDGSSSIRL